MFALLFAFICADAPPAATITPAPLKRNVFGDVEAVLRFRVEATRAVKGRVVWRVAEGSATVKVGEIDITATANAPADIVLKIAVPLVKDGVVAHWKLTVSVVEPDQRSPTATFEQDLWAFPRDPFAGRSAWLKKLRVSLFDPKGDTAKVLTAANVPFEQLQSADAVAGLKADVLVVGEGASFKDEKSLAAVLPKLAAAGVRVLILAPADGELVVPGIGAADGFDELAFRRDAVRRLDKRLDSNGWWAEARTLAANGAVGTSGWPWAEARATGGGRWVFCGLPLVANWDAHPAPRFLFARVLEYLTDSPE